MKRGLRPPPAQQPVPGVPAPPAGAVNPYVVPCAWRGPDGPCLLPGELGRGRRQGDDYYCGWHGSFVILGREYSAMGDRAEFDRFVLSHFRPYLYCGPFTHHTAEDLWLAVQGRRALGPRRPCARADCRREHQLEVPF